MENNWKRKGADYFLEEVGDIVNPLPTAVYKLEMVPMIGTLYLTQTDKLFSLPPKIYGVETAFIDRVLKTYKNTEGNLGVLMNGVKGTGKTLTAKQICNELKLPIIVIKDRYDNAPDFLNSIQEDVIVFFDEYEKTYDDYDHSILTVMDGVLTTAYRKLFLLTTNEAYVNSNMLQRPGRIRYFKTFGDLSLESIMEVVDDQLVNKEFKNELVKFLANLEIITIDIVTSVVEEVNIHNELPEKFKDVFNVKALDDVFDIYVNSASGKRELLYPRVKIDPAKPTRQCVGKYFRVNGAPLGTITEALKDEGFKVMSVGKPRVLDVATEIYTMNDDGYYHEQAENGIDEEDGDFDDTAGNILDKTKEKIITTYFIERCTGLHQVFSSFAF